jgi:hypothetical protein
MPVSTPAPKPVPCENETRHVPLKYAMSERPSALKSYFPLSTVDALPGMLMPVLPTPATPFWYVMAVGLRHVDVEVPHSLISVNRLWLVVGLVSYVSRY